MAFKAPCNSIHDIYYSKGSIRSLYPLYTLICSSLNLGGNDVSMISSISWGSITSVFSQPVVPLYALLFIPWICALISYGSTFLSDSHFAKPSSTARILCYLPMVEFGLQLACQISSFDLTLNLPPSGHLATSKLGSELAFCSIHFLILLN